MSNMRDAGRIGFRIRGEYSALEVYEYLDVVYYADASYVALKDVSGVTPEDSSEFWQVFARGWSSSGAVTGIKGAEELDFRHGNVSLSPADIGALPAKGKALTAGTADKVASPLTFTGAVTGDYDGSAPMSVTIPKAVSVKGDAEEEYRTGPVNITKGDIGLGKVENKSPAEIRAGLTAQEVENALGYSPSEVTVTVDGALSDTSENPVQNKVITGALKRKGDTLQYDEESSQLHLKSGETILSSVTIEAGGGGGGIKLAAPTGVSLENADEEILIKWTDPLDLVVADVTQATWAGTLVVRKVGSAPASKTDGTIVVDSKTRDAYKDTGFADTGLVNGTEYFYGIFPYTTDKAYTYGTTESMMPEAIYPDAPTSSSVKAGNATAVVTFELPENATGAKIAYSTQQPESTATPYGTVISGVTSPYTIAGLTNDIPYYITVYSTNAKGRDTPGGMLTATPKAAILYGFIIDQNESDPDSMITYIEDNTDFTPAHMDYEKGVFDYGSWGDAWFIRGLKPCMLRYDGTVAYELDPTEHKKKKDGTPSDVENVDFPGNAMIGIPKIYWKVVDRGDGKVGAYFSDTKLDDDLVCWSHLDNNGNEIDRCYMSIYIASLIGDRLRSLSGKNIAVNKTLQEFIDYARGNDPGSDIWSVEVFSDRMLIVLLSWLISRTTDSRRAFGEGRWISANNITGALDGAGMFYGGDTNDEWVKLFGLEGYTGSIYRFILGAFLHYGRYKTKMTYGKSDGSTVNGYNIDGTGYVSFPGYPPMYMTKDGYVNKCIFSGHGILPSDVSGSRTTYYTQYYFGTSQEDEALPLMTPSSISPNNGGVYEMGFYTPSDSALPNASCGLSCKPLAPTGGEPS